jgi:hypothetical protein
MPEFSVTASVDRWPAEDMGRKAGVRRKRGGGIEFFHGVQQHRLLPRIGKQLNLDGEFHGSILRRTTYESKEERRARLHPRPEGQGIRRAVFR